MLFGLGIASLALLVPGFHLGVVIENLWALPLLLVALYAGR
jgi:hypothetical protein